MSQAMPDWYEPLHDALDAAFQVMRQVHHGYPDEGWQPSHVYERLVEAREAGWDGSDYRFWAAAFNMAAFRGSMPQHPQRSFLDGEVRRWRKTLAARG